MIFIVKTYHNRKEEPIDRKTIKVEGIACPYCLTSHRLTGKVIKATGRRIIYCALCDNAFWENEGIKEVKKT